ncbi:MAG: T9SS type A sorting domain-containing protein [Flavobacteriales bacterium]|nr:T9SS type A sorting domain-containing protein [Flavobacteriales bacterium]
MKRILLHCNILLIAMLAAFTATAGNEITITDDGSGTGTTTWTSDNVYILDGFVFINDGQVLTIEAGTVIKGAPGTGADASALIVARGGKIMAEGTESDPIIFTFQADPLDGSTPYSTKGQWGGLIILGSAQLNSSPGESQIEGIPETEPRGLYGGNDDADDSGVVTYVSIRHGGTDIGAGNEINGLTLGGVGNGTVIEHIEIISNADDGIEFFGGTAEVKWACVAFVGDDSFDYDEGWRGKGQFWFTVQDTPESGEGDRGGEHDGGTDPEDGTPYAHPVISNVTSMGKGISEGKRALTFRDNAGGEYHNSIFFNWGKGIDVENLASGEDSYERLLSGELAFMHNCFYDTKVAGDGASATDLFTISMGSGWATPQDSTDALTASSTAFAALFATNSNEVANPGLSYDVVAGSGGANSGLGIVPLYDVSGAVVPSGDFYSSVTYKGAFDPAEPCDPWIKGWTMIDEYGFVGCYSVGVEEVATVNTFNVYPNPASEVVYLQSTMNLTNAVAKVYGINGALVNVVRLGNVAVGQVAEINAEGLKPGMYTLVVIADENSSTSRFIKK